MKKINGYELINLFEQFSPKKLAVEGDKIGLQVGSLNEKIKRVMIALDVTEAIVDEAIAKDVQLIIAHHPLIFRPLQNIITNTGYGKLVEKLIKHDIAVYAAHTNLDITKGGVNDMLASALNLNNLEILAPTHKEDDEEYGLGRLGLLKEEMSLQEFANYVKYCLDVPTVRVIGNLSDRVKKVAVLGGDGNKYITAAKFAGADVYLSGDIYYHTAHDAQMLNLNIVDAGHNIEKIMKQGVKEVLSTMCTEKAYDVEIISSEISTEPFQFM